MEELNKQEIEDLDFEILRMLSDDGRKSFRELAKELEKSPVTIKNHVDQLEKQGIIKNYGVNLNYEKLGYDIIAFIEITISKGKMLEVEKDLAHLPNIYGVYDVTGTYDAIILARFKTRNELSKLVKKINSYEYVVRTNTHLILNIIKEGTNFTDLLKYEAVKNNKT
jgi:DNA-binding Lrp family transcriptional regulator